MSVKLEVTPSPSQQPPAIAASNPPASSEGAAEAGPDNHQIHGDEIAKPPPAKGTNPDAAKPDAAKVPMTGHEGHSEKKMMR